MDVPPRVAHADEIASIDAEHYALELTIDPVAHAIDGDLKLRFVATEEGLPHVTLDLAGLKVYNVVDSAGRDLAFFQKGEELTIVLAEPLSRGATEELGIRYGGSPKKGLWFTDTEHGVATQIFTQGECEDSHWWFPCIDNPADRATSELIVTLPAGWTATAAGERIDRKESAGSTTEHWRMNTPHPAYLTSLVAGDFTVKTADWDGTPLVYMGDPKYRDLIEASFASTPRALEFLSDVTGLRYPYSKYSQACVDDFPFGGMENISATTMTDTMLRTKRGMRDGDAEGLIVHEAAHQWFGDLLTCNSWDHVWLNEGFATYMTQLYFGSMNGDDELRMRWYDSLQGYLSSDVGSARRPTVYSTYRDPIDLFFTGQTYAGGAARLHYLRFVLGDAAFFSGLRTYVAENQGRGVTTYDLKAAMQKASGQDLTAFFDQWLFGEGYPELDVSWKWSAKQRAVRLTVRQTQNALAGTPEVFNLPVDVALRTTKGTVVHRIEINQRSQVFELASDAAPDWIWFDEGGWLPAKVKRQKSPAEWLTVAASSDAALPRRLAVEALGDSFGGGTAFDMRGDQQDFVRAELVNRLRQDSSSWVRKAAATALGQEGGAESRLRLMTAASSDENTHVRRAAFEALQRWGEDFELAAFARTQYEEGYSWKTMGAAAHLLATSDPKGIFQWTLRELFVANSPHETLRAELLDVMVGLDNVRAVPQLVLWATDPTAGSGARIAAVRGLGELKQLDKEARQALIGLLGTHNARLRRSVVESLAKYDDAVSKTALQDFYAQTVFPREKRAIEAAFGR
jgi:aminopeptidase N